MSYCPLCCVAPDDGDSGPIGQGFRSVRGPAGRGSWCLSIRSVCRPGGRALRRRAGPPPGVRCPAGCRRSRRGTARCAAAPGRRGRSLSAPSRCHWFGRYGVACCLSFCLVLQRYEEYPERRNFFSSVDRSDTYPIGT